MKIFLFGLGIFIFSFSVRAVELDAIGFYESSQQGKYASMTAMVYINGYKHGVINERVAKFDPVGYDCVAKLSPATILNSMKLYMDNGKVLPNEDIRQALYYTIHELCPSQAVKEYQDFFKRADKKYRKDWIE